jgi:hypothetical protein
MLGIMIGTKYRNFVQDLPYIIPTKQPFIVHPSFRGEDFFFISANQKKEFPMAGLDINVCPVPVKTNVGQVDLVLRLSDGTSEKIRFPNEPVRRKNLFPLVKNTGFVV